MLAQHDGLHIVLRGQHIVVRDKVAEVRIVLLTDRRLERSGLSRNLHNLHDLFLGHIESLCEFRDTRLIAELQRQLSLHLAHLVDSLDHVHRHAYGSRLICERARHGLAYPPSRIGRELKALLGIELLDTLDETQVALLHEVQEAHAASRVALRDADHQAEVRLNQLLLRLFIAGLLSSRKLHLFFRGEQRNGADFL